MKRVFGLVLVLFLLLTLCACGNGGSDNENGGENPGGEEHTHAFGAWTTVTESTCAVAGSQQRACDCGETETQALALKAHTASDWIVDKPAASAQDGHQYQKCTVCGAILKEETISKDTVGSQGLEYAVNSDDKSCTITGMGICKDSEVVIPAVIDGYRVTSIGWNAFDGCSGLRSIQIPDSVIRIGAYAFRNCSSLRSIEIPDGVTSIDGWVFDCCRSLTSVQIPDSVTKIGYGAFNVCGSLESIQIPDSVTNIEGYVFHSCSKLKSIRFDGTKEGWETILKGDDWDSDTGNYTVYCTDGTIAK